MHTLKSKLLWSGLAAALLVACSTPVSLVPAPPTLGSTAATPLAMKAASPGTLLRCVDLAQGFQHANTALESSSVVAEGPVTVGGQPSAWRAVEHCWVKGLMHKRVGADGQDYAIGFEMRLPSAWNGRFFYQANGGIDGVVQPAVGALGGGPVTSALAQGFAVISADAGHTARQNPRFGEEPTARSDYGHGAVTKLTPMAKALIAAAYGRGPDRSYIGGCSNGGRHALMAASRLPEAYDGYLVGAPGYRLPNAALAQLWAGPLWLSLATPDATVPAPFPPGARVVDLGSGFTPQERSLVAAAVLARCDALDGLADGLVQDVKACQASFNLQRDVKACEGGNRTGQCLTAEQKRILDAVQAGGKLASGSAIYSSFPYDPGMGGANWATWKFMNSQTLDPAAGFIFMSPPRPITPFKVDVEDSYKAIFATTERFTTSAHQTISVPSAERPDSLVTLRDRGAKVLLYHGVSDAIFSETDTRAWVDRANASVQGSRFVRYFPVPGMNHCGAGPAADQFDALTPLVDWVEKGQAPAAITAQVRGVGNAAAVNAELPKDWSPTRTRPLCAYPTVARYKGGNREVASGFACEP